MDKIPERYRNSDRMSDSAPLFALSIVAAILGFGSAFLAVFFMLLGIL